MNLNVVEKYSKYRREHPLLSADIALRWAKQPDYAAEWIGTSYTGYEYEREVEGFRVVLTIEHESECPMEGDGLGHYVEGVRHSDWDTDWNGNYPRPAEELPLNLPYTTFASGAYSQDRHAYPYFVPDHLEDHYESLRRRGQSKSVAWLMVKEDAEDTIRKFFGGPLVYCHVQVTAYKDDIELGQDTIYTSYISGDDDDYPFTCAAENGMVETAVSEAKDAIVRLTN